MQGDTPPHEEHREPERAEEEERGEPSAREVCAGQRSERVSEGRPAGEDGRWDRPDD